MSKNNVAITKGETCIFRITEVNRQWSRSKYEVIAENFPKLMTDTKPQILKLREYQ